MNDYGKLPEIISVIPFILTALIVIIKIGISNIKGNMEGVLIGVSVCGGMFWPIAAPYSGIIGCLIVGTIGWLIFLAILTRKYKPTKQSTQY